MHLARLNTNSSKGVSPFKDFEKLSFSTDHSLAVFPVDVQKVRTSNAISLCCYHNYHKIMFLYNSGINNNYSKMNEVTGTSIF